MRLERCKVFTSKFGENIGGYRSFLSYLIAPVFQRFFSPGSNLVGAEGIFDRVQGLYRPYSKYDIHTQCAKFVDPKKRQNNSSFNQYLVTKIGVSAAENEPSEVSSKLKKLVWYSMSVSGGIYFSSHAARLEFWNASNQLSHCRRLGQLAIHQREISARGTIAWSSWRSWPLPSSSSGRMCS